MNETKQRDDEMSKSSEPAIRINGTQCSNGMAMTIRVAVESFASSLHDEGLGDDDHGKAMTEVYLDAIHKIRQAMYGDPQRPVEMNLCVTMSDGSKKTIPAGHIVLSESSGQPVLRYVNLEGQSSSFLMGGDAFNLCVDVGLLAQE